jgi:hypothetical protein
LRQSTPAQVRLNVRSTERQYAIGECPRICVGMDELERHAFYDNQDP